MGFDPSLFVLWNIFPIIVATFVFSRVKDLYIKTNSVLHMLVAIAAIHTFFHIIMAFDIGKSATGSSTSALAYIVFPIYTLIFGVLIYAISKFIRFFCAKYASYK